MDPHDDLLAARYALGVADLAEIVAVESRMDADAAFAARVDFYDNRFFALAGHDDAVAPPPAIWDRIARAIDDDERSPRTRTVRGAELAWEPFLPGIERKILFADKAAATSGVLYRIAPGARVIDHCHGIIEECLVLEGEIEVDGITVRAGDMHMAFSGVRHGPLTSPRGAMVYIRGDLQIHL